MRNVFLEIKKKESYLTIDHNVESIVLSLNRTEQCFWKNIIRRITTVAMLTTVANTYIEMPGTVLTTLFSLIYGKLFINSLLDHSIILSPFDRREN